MDDDKPLATVQKIDQQLRALHQERYRLALMAGMVLDVQVIDERIDRLEKERTVIVEGAGKEQGPGVKETP